MAIANRVRERMASGIKRLTPVIAQQKARDVSEADTVTVVKDVLSDVMGYDKYAELTSEHAIRGTYCDLAIKIGEKLRVLVEIKAAATELEDRHVKQAIDYAANQGIDWVILTNASVWRLYEVIFEKPIDKKLIVEVDLTAIEMRKDDDAERVYIFTKEAFSKGAPEELRDRQEATSRFMLAALVVENDAVVSTIRRELRRLVDVLVDEEQIVKVLREEVVKRDTLEGPCADAAIRRVNRAEAAQRAAKTVASKDRIGVPEAGADTQAAEANPQATPPATTKPG